MAIDGSFRLDFEFQRFLSRCPELVPHFAHLSNKENMLTEEEVVNAVAELFLHPNSTIPLVGCFRPIVEKILGRIIEVLSLVPNLKSNSRDSMAEFDEDKLLSKTEDVDTAQVLSMVQLYAKSGMGLNLHELACLAFSRALHLVPSLLGSVLTYFIFAPAPFQRIMLRDSDCKLSEMVGSQLLNVVRISLRLLFSEAESFTTLWDWSCFLDLVQQFADLDRSGEAEFLKTVSDIRWGGMQILSVVLKINDKVTANYGPTVEEAFTCLLRWHEYCQDVCLEKAGWYLELNSVSIDMNQGPSTVSASRFHEVDSSNSNTRWATWDMKSSGKPFFLTSSLEKSFEMIQLAVSQRWPVLLYGPTGAGKTALFNKLAHHYGNRVLSIYMDEQIDGKTLIGSYVCTEQPGEFRWQPGSLTQAVLNGFWVVFEDIDKAPADVLSILLPLLEGASSFLTGHGEAVRVAEGFRLFSTISSPKIDKSRATEGRNSLGALWRRVMIGPSNNKELVCIVKAWYPDLEHLADKLIETFERVNELTGFHFSSSGGRFSVRDLLKWCKRISSLGFCFGGVGLPAHMCDRIYQEAVDIFAAFSSSVDKRLTIMKEIANIWTVLPTSSTNTLYNINKPVIQELRSDLRVGRITLQRTQTAPCHNKKPFVEIRTSLHVLERIACSVKCNEPVLLVGETGTGKTTLVQNLATRLGQKLTVLNLSQQSDVEDLLGGFKPMSAQFVCIPLYMEFENLFVRTFSSKGNDEFLTRIRKFVSDKNWKMLLSGFQKGVQKIIDMGKSGSGTKRKRPLDEGLLKSWDNFSRKLTTASARMSNASAGMLFSFVEGAFVTALKNGEWILLDEVNLAPPEMLQRMIGVLEEENGSLCLAERGDVEYIPRHPNFRIFACMNPATDAGKRDLPFSIRSRFTEYFVDDVSDDDDLILFINQFMDDNHSNRELVGNIVKFYKAAKRESEERLQDGANQKPQYSLRSLYRALEYTKKARKNFGSQKALYDGFCMFFLSLLDDPSAKLMQQLILSHFVGGSVPQPVPFDRYLMARSGTVRADDLLQSYVLTKSVKEHLSNLARAIFIGRYPVLLQGPTSSGKTSLVQFLAAITGHDFVRINNHEHTDLQEYLGSYITESSGRLVFHEGILVKAVRNGYWIVLDELNLAPSDVLEALNRLLDDNRELFVTELNETVRAHPNFMLFATQNPPTFYGGRKMLSRAFRNRFVEINVDEIPKDELSTILERRCKIPDSYAKKMVEVMKDLQLHRQSSKVFAGKHGFITPRDLFRWADRFRMFGSSYEDLARDGYFLLAERLRDDSEKRIVQGVLERQLRVKLSKDDMYKQEPGDLDRILNSSRHSEVSENLGRIIWTESMWRLYLLIERCYMLREPVLLVGETGGGKTTACQLLSICLGARLHILNCHQYTETSDFLGGFYPVRERSKISSEFRYRCEQMMQLKAFSYLCGEAIISSDISQAPQTLNQLAVLINNYRQGLVTPSDVTLQEFATIEQMKMELVELHQKWQTIFVWQDGPLVEAMKNGDLFLVDEISLADDSVLERLNSVLEPERKLSLAEKGGPNLEKITAHPNFFLLATMNPGGDYGKKELSPALRNRFTEIWVPSVSDLKELKSIAQDRISNSDLFYIVDLMLNFWEWFNQLQTGRMLTVRDLLSWVAFIKVIEENLEPEFAFLHGSFLVLLDGLSLGTGMTKNDAAALRQKCLCFLLEQIKEWKPSLDYSKLCSMEDYGWANLNMSANTSASIDTTQTDSYFGIHPFYIEKGDDHVDVDGFEFLAPTTRRNALRALRAMQLPKPVLLEGSPGVGKTSLVVAIGKFSGHMVVRINLSEQTDIMDLLGSDLPVEGDDGIQFAWSDGILLQALKQGHWVLLDELNLAPQSVLEGLNAILDHRAEVFIPELGRTFKCPSSFRVFACQNPSCQGGGRKGLPKSFLNRFTKVYVDELVEDDYLCICHSLYPSIPKPMLSKLILFNKLLHEGTMQYHKFGQDGSPWEFNLRDVIRSCQLIQGAPERSKSDCFLNTIYVQRMRTSADRRQVLLLYEHVFDLKPFINPFPQVQLSPEYLIVGNTRITRNHSHSLQTYKSELKILPGSRNSLEAVAHCVKHQWMCILIGPTSSGKTSLIRLLAQLTGRVLNELNLSSATDISELLGCFEQYNAFRNYRLAIGRVECFINEYCSLQLEPSTEVFIRRKNLMARWLNFLSSIDYGFSNSASTYCENWTVNPFGSVSLLLEIIEHMIQDLENYILSVSWSRNDLDKILKTIGNLVDDSKRRLQSVRFEWVTGLLITAIENGEWIVLENANLCNPTVLDRINSLVEQSGSITVNECGTVDGKPVVLHPHPQFRMFLTVNPTYGEVSRAMRNRGVEIYMMQPHWLLDEDRSGNCEAELKEVKRFLVLSGIPISKLVDSMAKAHIYARDKGLHLGVRITYLELARWVQLFQQLLTDGKGALWSLHISWQHTYLSSLGETEGKSIIDHAQNSYLSVREIYKLDSFESRSLCLPGGWPTPLKLQELVCYSKESCVRQNCMYLESLGALCASYSFGSAVGRYVVEHGLGAASSYLVDAKMLHGMVFPRASVEMVADYGDKNKFDMELAMKMLFIAANWTIEQATEGDFDLYLLWFSWFGSKLQPFLQFFNSFLVLLKQERDHPIWRCIFRCRELISRTELDLKQQPILSVELIDNLSSDDGKKLSNAINCVGLLRLNYQQWNAEGEYDFTDITRCFIPVLRSLRGLEEKVLHLLVSETDSFDELFSIYNDLLEDHILFWKGVISSQFECLLISWRSLVKDAAKLEGFCSREVENFHKESKNLERVSSLSLHSQKSLLWIHGGHPFLPSSADIYQKQHQLLRLCELVWPRKTKSWELAVADNSVEAAVSSESELRVLAVQGVCMSAHIMGKDDEAVHNIVHQLEDMYQMLLRKFEYEKRKLETKIGGTTILSDLSACCVFSPDILCTRSGFDSWLATLPLVDETSFLLDMGILQELSKTVMIDEEHVKPALSSLSDLLESTLNLSLNFSSRPPTDFAPHQKILWTLDAWTSGDAANTKLSSFVLEMWFSWHKSLWTHSRASLKKLSAIHGYDVLLPDMLFQPVKMVALDNILRTTLAIRDYSVHMLKVRVASRNLWLRPPQQMTYTPSFLLSAAQCLFQQVIFAHKKSFEADKYAAIQSIISSSQKRMITQDNINTIISLLSSSNHYGLTSLLDSVINPLLGELYLPCSSSSETLFNIGCAWLRIGALRYHLLICCDDLDPALKYSFKYSQLTKKIASLELEIEVRKECEHLAGCFSFREAANQKRRLFENLRAEQRKLQKQIVFRSDPGKFKKLKYECDEFISFVVTSLGFTSKVKNMPIQEIADQVHNWQETITRFIERLSSEYAAYIDIVEPVHVALYEMKLGLALVLSSALHKNFLDRIGEDDMNKLQRAIYSFVRFPRGGYTSEAPSLVTSGRMAKLTSSDIEFPTNIGTMDMRLLEKLATSTSNDDDTDKMGSGLQLKAMIYQNILVRVAHSVTDTSFMDNASFKLLDKIFDEFPRLWMKMKDELKTNEEHEAQQYKFRPRAFEIDSIIQVDISTLGSSIANETFSEWQEMVSEEEFNNKKADEDPESLEEDWNFLQDTILNNMVHVHNALFGSVDLIKSPGSIQVSEADRLSTFIDSYTLGIRMSKNLEGLLSCTLDAQLLPEHLLRLCLEHEQKFSSSHKTVHAYNFYKDSNAPAMAKMVEPVVNLQKRIGTLLNEWDGHPALQKILDVIDMVLAIPLTTPLAKALSGVQFLLNRVRTLQETVSKFPLADQLEPIFVLVSSWQKLEFDSWPALLNEVQTQFEINAGKLWFPLYTVLLRRHHADNDNEYNRSTIQSLEEFIQTSSTGEFRKRLQLLFAFHGQTCTGISRGFYSSCELENVKILYNIFGFYIQLFPIILEHTEASRRSMELEVKELLKLCRWERSDSYLTMETSKKTRQKLRKIIEKYTDQLQQPVMLVLTQEAARRGIQSQSPQVPNLLGDSFERNRHILSFAFELARSRDENMSRWLTTWRNRVDIALRGFYHGKPVEFEFPYRSLKDVEGLKYLEESKQVWYAIEKICRAAIDYGELWNNDEKKSVGKRRRSALPHMLKILGSCGLVKHRFTSSEVTTNQSLWVCQPSYNLQHLLLTEGMRPSKDMELAALGELQKNMLLESQETEWKTANQYFFKSIASVHHLRQICLNFHKDFTLEQVTQSVSYLDHLIAIEQEQRAAAYDFAEQVKYLRNCMLTLENLSTSECSISQNQHVTFECMWRQKQILDSLCATMNGESLLLRTVEHNHHLTTCQNGEGPAKQIRLFIDKFFLDFQKSKDLLDMVLLGHNGVITAKELLLQPYGVTKQMEQMVHQNLFLVREFEDHLHGFHKQCLEGGAIKDVLFGHFEQILEKSKLIAEEFNSDKQARNYSESSNRSGREASDLEVRFGQALMRTYKSIEDALHSVVSGHALPEDSPANITISIDIFKSNVENLQLGAICEDLVKTISLAGEMVNCSGHENPCLGTHLKHMYSLLNPLHILSDGLLHDFLVMHRSVSMMAHAVARIFASLYSQGFRDSVEEEQVDDGGRDLTQDATGTGMGDGIGVNDVSDQINDEDQLLGASEKPGEEKDASNDVPSKDDKGVEMDQDFDGGTFSVSEDSEDDNKDEDDEDEQLDKAMGETGIGSDIIDEKLRDKDDDDGGENPSNMNEKYEPGPSVKDEDPSARELRGKEDDSADVADESGGDLAPDKSDKPTDEQENPEGIEEDMQDMKIDNKEEAFSDPTGLKLDELNPTYDHDVDMDTDEQEGGDDDPMEDDAGPEELDESVELKNGEDMETNATDETLNEAEPEQLAGDSAKEDIEKDNEKNAEMDLLAPKKDSFGPSSSSLYDDHAPNMASATQPQGDSHAAAALNDVTPEAKWSNSNNNQNDLAPSRGLPNSSENEIAVADSSNSGKLSDGLPNNSQLPQNDSSLQKIQPNPYRNVGDALEKWKERVKVSSDVKDKNDVEALDDDMGDENAEEYGFTSENDKGTAQTLGSAAPEQINGNIKGNEADGDGRTENGEENAAMEVDNEQQPGTQPPLKSYAANIGNKIEGQKEVSQLEKQLEESPDVYNRNNGDVTRLSESLVSLRKSYMSEDINQLSTLPLTSNDLGKAQNLEEIPGDVKDKTNSLWRKLELLTTRLSQELTEQLRLIMEPTLASKLQGDYKTGKRINMKRVIPFIASGFRKVNIWLRRTKPNKRDYQVVIAVDDSRSMSESGCGDVAIEALVTVCRAMSQLEVGNLAVASFGKKGNIKLLHDFDQPFTPEAGIKMLSSLTFKQENTIADEPMVDLLKYLDNKLDDAVMNARLPSGQNPLQQLVLIIADGRFHEKENLKRCVRDMLNKNRMVAFLLLDSPQESIMDLMEASFQSGNVKFTKYMDSFPFPFYVLLKDIEALPRTLGDLLRQWFELMQHSRNY